MNESPGVGGKAELKLVPASQHAPFGFSPFPSKNARWGVDEVGNLRAGVKSCFQLDIPDPSSDASLAKHSRRVVTATPVLQSNCSNHS